MKHWVVGIVGQSEFGKTYLTRKLVSTTSRLIVVDPKAEFDGLIIKENFEDFIRSTYNKERFRVACQFDNVVEYELLFDSIREHYTNILLVVDEISIFDDPYQQNNDLRHIVQIVGSKKRINVLWNCQRPANVSRNVSSQSHIILSFRVLESQDAKYFSSKWRSRDGEEKLSKLKVGQFEIVRGDSALFEKFSQSLKKDLTKT